MWVSSGQNKQFNHKSNITVLETEYNNYIHCELVKLCGLLKNGKHTSHKNEVLRYEDKNMNDMYIWQSQGCVN